MNIIVKENNFNNLLIGIKGKVIKKFDNENYEIALTSKYYGKVYLKENEFEIIK